MRTRAEPARPDAPSSARCPNGTSGPLSGHGQPEFRPTSTRAEAECKAFAEAYQGTLDALGAAPSARARRSPRRCARYEAIEDLLGRLMSYAGLVYAGDTTDPERAKFYGDTQERLTAASRDLLFFALELNRIDDAVLDAAMAAEPARAITGPGSRTSARRSRTSSTTGSSSCSTRSP